MGKMIGKKSHTDVSVYDASLERIRDIFDRADNVSVGFSGGKDSTVCLNLALQVAREKKRTPLTVHFFDEEAIVPDTVDYVRRVSKIPGIDLKWWCIPILHRNGCSRKEPYWYPWDPRKEDIWTRPMPPEALTVDDLPVDGFQLTYKGETHTKIPTINHLIEPESKGMNIHITGIRADESMRRFQAVARREVDNYFGNYENYPYIMLAHPIYDWTDLDVWTAVNKLGWDYNTAYDRYRQMGISTTKQRVAPPYGEEPMQALHTFAKAWPELWGKMSERVKGAATAARYSQTGLYAFNKRPVRNKERYPKPMDYIVYLIGKFPEDEQKLIAASINQAIKYHRKESGNTRMLESEANPKSGLCWETLYMIAMRGDLKNRKLAAIQAGVRSNARKKSSPTTDKRSKVGRKRKTQTKQLQP